MRQEKDRSSKWLIENHGDAILKLANVTGFQSWRAIQSEIVAPRRLPDGLLEVKFPGLSGANLFLIEIETYADREVAIQIFEDILLTRVERGTVADAIVVVLRPKGRVEVESRIEESSQHGLTAIAGAWRVVELWKLEATDLLAANDVGLIPWVPLTQFSGPPEQLLRQCREGIDRLAKPEEHDALLAVTSILTTAVFNDRSLLKILGGNNVMLLDTPLMNELLAERDRRRTRRHILVFLQARFGSIPNEVVEQIEHFDDDASLENLLRLAGQCPDLETFRTKMAIN